MSDSPVAATAGPPTIDWRRFFNFRAWRRWFSRALIQSGRLTALLALVGLWFIRIDDPSWLQYLRAKTFDVYQQIKPRVRPVDSPVVIADIDEKSISELGQWPWPRTTLATMIDKLSEMDAKVIAFDSVFPETDRLSLHSLSASLPNIDAETRARLNQAKDNDEVFAEAIKRSGRVVLGEPLIDQQREANGAESLTSFVAVGPNPNKFIIPETAVLRNLPILDAASAGRGIFDFSVAFDGIVRSVPLVMRVNDERHAALVLDALRVGAGSRSIMIRGEEDGINAILIRARGSKENTKIESDRYASVRVYFAPHETFVPSYIPIADIISGRVDPSKIAGKYVLVGMSATGIINDLRSTPLDQGKPGVEVHANLLENALFNAGLARVPEAEGYEVIATLLLSLVVIIVTPWAGARIGAISFFVISGAIVWWSWHAFAQQRQLYDPVFSVLVAFLFYSFLTYVAFSREESQKKQIRGAFGQYLSPAVVEQLASDPSQLKLGGEKRRMTFMFSDVRGFTSISELFSAEGLTQLINRLLTPLTNVILGRSGTIDKYMGDCVMAFWNAPLPVKDHEREACRAAFEMLRSMDQLNAELEAEAKQAGREHRPLAVGIGINSGEAVVGNMGSDRRFDYSVLGDAVNLASRLEGQSKAYGVTIVIGEQTADKVRDFAVIEMDLIKVKGKTEAVRIFTVLGDETVGSDPAFKALAAMHEQVLAAYRAQRWDEAEAKMVEARALAAKGPGLMPLLGGLYDLYAERIVEYRAEPPPADWDAVYVATSK